MLRLLWSYVVLQTCEMSDNRARKSPKAYGYRRLFGKQSPAESARKILTSPNGPAGPFGGSCKLIGRTTDE